MTLFSERRFIRWLIIIVSFVLISLFLWNVSIFFDRIKKKERNKMEIWVNAYADIKNTPLNEDFNSLSLSIIRRNTSTPMIEYYVKEGTYNTRNIPKRKIETTREIKELVSEFKSENKPIKIKQNGEVLSIIYYGNSQTLQSLTYLPFIIIGALILFIGIIYYFYVTSKTNEQNKLWAGMAKETAHQIGTPLSSLVGWTELLKTTSVKKDYVEEIEKDVQRLQTITERFSKIGSEPTLEKADFVKITEETFDYLNARSSNLIELSLKKPEESIPVKINEQLFSWCIENLIKNATDATKGRGEIELDIESNAKYAFLFVSDTGKGIPKNKFKTIFKPGYTSRKRGWGLGLSLAKRIIEEYHEGRIRVLKSELGQGTTFEIRLRKVGG